MHDNKGKTHTQEHFQTEFSLRSVFFTSVLILLDFFLEKKHSINRFYSDDDRAIG